MGRSDLELRGLNDYASTGSGPTRQSDARDSEPLHVSVAWALAGYLLFDNRSFFLCDANLDRLAADHSNEERILSCNDASQEERYGFESSNK